MSKKLFLSILAIGLLCSFMPLDLPKAWFKAGSKPNSYDMGVDKKAGMDGKNAATIKSLDKDLSDAFGTLMQQSSPKKYLGKRIKMSGYMKSENVDGWAGFWLRVDQEGSQEPLSFDNMQDRSIKGTTEWKKYEIVLDVPSNASNVAFGALLAGTGQIWFCNLSFEVVGNSTATTGGGKKGKATQDEPTNLDFSE